MVVKGDTSVLLCAWIVGHLHHALLMLHNVWVRAPSARILLLHIFELGLLNRSK